MGRQQNKESAETEDLRQGKVQLTAVGWEKINSKITELHRMGKAWLHIAGKMDLTENTLRKLRREKEAYRTNYTDLAGIFQIFKEGKAPQEITPIENKDYVYVLLTKREPGLSLPYELSCFHGREQALQTLRVRFLKGERKQAISGVGGIGKTSLALKYASTFENEYKPVFWVNAEKEETIRLRYAEFARRRGLVKGEGQEQEEAVAATRRWLEANSGWLLVLDNADTPEILHAYLPQNGNGHILLTTRAHALKNLDIRALLTLETISEAEAQEFLLDRCSRPNASADERRKAAELARELGCFPLALAHAGAYIAHNATTFRHYLELYTEAKRDVEQRLALLDAPNMVRLETHLKSLRTTWEINFQALEAYRGTGRPGAYALELLNFCAFIGTDDIPCELVLSGAKEFCPPLDALIAAAQSPLGNALPPHPGGAKRERIYHELLQPLIEYSLVTKSLEDPPRFSVHHVMQMVVADRLGDQRREWQERVTRAVDGAFPIPDVENWRLCERLQPHAVAVAEMIRQERPATQASGHLLYHLGEFLCGQGRYALAETYARLALQIREEHWSDLPSDIADSLQSVGNICHYQAVHLQGEAQQEKYREAEALLEQSLTMRRQSLPRDDLAILPVLHDKAALYNGQKRWPQAESAYLELLSTAETILRDDARVAFIYHGLGWACYGQQRYEEARRWFHRVLEHAMLSPEVSLPVIVNCLHDIAQAYRRECRFADAARFYARALRAQKKAYPRGHPTTATICFNIAELYRDTQRYAKAEKYYQRAIMLDRALFGAGHSSVHTDLQALAKLYALMGRQEDAAATQRQADAISQQRQQS